MVEHKTPSTPETSLTLGTPVGSVPLGDSQLIQDMWCGSVEAFGFDAILVDLFPLFEYIPGARKA
jgi:hypothetical protein